MTSLNCESREAERESSWITHVSLLLNDFPENNQNNWLYHGILIHKYNIRVHATRMTT